MNGFTKKNTTIIGVIVLICMAIGSFYDLSLSQYLWNMNSSFGKLGAAYGQAPAGYGLSMIGALLLYITEKEKTFKAIGSYFMGALFLSGGILVCFHGPTKYLELPNVVLYSISLIVMVVVNGIMLRIVKNTDKQTIKQFLKFTCFIIIGAMLVVNILKLAWERPRMRMLSQVEYAALGVAFQPWWQIGSKVKEAIIAVGVASDEFKSFPSGHTAGAACMLIITALPYLNERFKGKENLLFWVSVVFSFLVGLSRIVMGAHFLTDITMGFAITFVMTKVAYQIFLKGKN